jgi:hypothetical protein
MKLYRRLLVATALFAISSYPIQFQPWRAIAGGQSNKAEGFAIYLLAKDVSAFDLPKADLKRLVLQDRPVLAEADIIAYGKATHQLQISEAAFTRIKQLFSPPIKTQGIPFVVCVGKEPIYAGAFWTHFSSRSYEWVVIIDPFVQRGQEKIIRIGMGYPGPDFVTRADPRADKRIMDSLDAKGKLK